MKEVTLKIEEQLVFSSNCYFSGIIVKSVEEAQKTILDEYQGGNKHGGKYFRIERKLLTTVKAGTFDSQEEDVIMRSAELSSTAGIIGKIMHVNDFLKTKTAQHIGTPGFLSKKEFRKNSYKSKYPGLVVQYHCGSNFLDEYDYYCDPDVGVWISMKEAAELYKASKK